MSSPYSFDTHVGKTPREWEKFVDSCSYGSIFQTNDWVKAVQEAGLKTLLIIAREKRGDIVGGMLATYGQSSYFNRRIILNMHVMGAPLIEDPQNEQVLKGTISIFDKKSRQLGALASFIRTFCPFNDIVVRELHYVIDSDSLPCTVMIDTSRPLEEVWKSLPRDTRWGIRRATKEGVILAQVESTGELADYHRLHLLTCSRLGIAPMSFDFFKAIWQNLHSNDNIKVFLAKHHGKPIAGRIILRWKDKMWAWHGSSLKEYWGLHANHLLDWHSVEWGNEQGVKTYDLLGIPCEKVKTHPKYGLYLYKTGFGGKVVKHGEYVKHYSPLKFFVFSKILGPIHRRLFRVPPAQR